MEHEHYIWILFDDSYSFKSENNGCSIYMSNIFYDHAPLMSGLFSLNLDSSDTHVHSIEAKRYKFNNDKCNLFVALPFRSYWCKAHEETPC